MGVGKRQPEKIPASAGKATEKAAALENLALSSPAPLSLGAIGQVNAVKAKAKAKGGDFKDCSKKKKNKTKALTSIAEDGPTAEEHHSEEEDDEDEDEDEEEDHDGLQQGSGACKARRSCKKGSPEQPSAKNEC